MAKHVRFIMLCGIFLFAFIAPLQAQDEPTHITVSVLPYISYIPFAIAQEEGYFAEQNLEVEFVREASSAVLFPALIEGELDVHVALNAPGFYNSVYRGANIRAVSDRGYLGADSCVTTALMVRTELLESGAFDDPEQVREMVVGSSRTNDTGYYLDAALESLGLSLDDLQFEEVPATSTGDALTSGAVQIIRSTEPQITRLLNVGGNSIWYAANQLYPDSQLAFIVFGPSILEGNEEIGQRFMIAYLKAVRQFLEGKTERNLDIAEAFTELDRDLLEATCWGVHKPDGTVNIESMMAYQEWALNEGIVDGVVQPEDFWDSSFIEYANEALGTPLAEATPDASAT